MKIVRQVITTVVTTTREVIANDVIIESFTQSGMETKIKKFIIIDEKLVRL